MGVNVAIRATTAKSSMFMESPVRSELVPHTTLETDEFGVWTQLLHLHILRALHVLHVLHTLYLHHILVLRKEVRVRVNIGGTRFDFHCNDSNFVDNRG